MDPSKPWESTTMSAGDRCNYCFKFHWRGIFIVMIPLIFLPLLFLEPVKEFRCAYVVAIMALFWVTEALPLYITSMFPIVLFPIMGILDTDTACKSYFKDSLFFFFGTLCIAIIFEHCNLHQRIALNVILVVGCSPRKLHLSLTVVATFISMWITNAATAAMMCPIAKAILDELEAQNLMKTTREGAEEGEPPYPSKIVNCYYIGIAYAATMGGCGTVIGSATNFILQSYFDDDSISFFKFMAFNVPPMVVHSTLTFLWLEFLYMGMFRPTSPEAVEIKSLTDNESVAREVIRQKKNDLGSMSLHEVQVAFFFIIMVVIFLSRKPGFTTGWAEFFTEKEVKNSMPTILILAIFFILPINYYFMKYFICKAPEKDKPIPSLINWRTIHERFPWGLLFLLGGGFSLAEGIKESGFANMVGNAMKFLENYPKPMVQFLVLTFTIFATNFSANMAILNIIGPVLLEMADAIEISRLYLVVPAGIICSMAFHLPVGTPTNAIVYEFARLRSIDMAIAGIGPSVISLFGFWTFSQIYAPVVWPNFNGANNTVT